MAVSINISITQNSQSKVNNTSNITVRVKASWTYGSFNLNKCSGSCTINGAKYTFSSSFNTGKITSGSSTIYTKTLDIKHGSDGRKTLSCSASFASGVSSGTVTDSASKTLTAIPVESDEPDTPDTPISQSVSSTDTTITWRLYGFKVLSRDTRNFMFTAEGPGSGTTGTVSRLPGTSDVTFTFTGLVPNTTYSLHCTRETVNPETGATTGTGSYTNTGTTKQESTTLSILTSPSSDSLWVYAYGINRSAIDRQIILRVDTEDFYHEYIPRNTYPSTYSAYYYEVEEGKNYTATASLIDTSNGALVRSERSSATIPYDTAMSISASDIGETAITVQAYGLNGNKNYARSLKWYRKGPKDTDYVLKSTTQINANTSNTSFTFPQSGLRANTAYGFKVELLKGAEVLKTLTVSANTLQASGKLEVENIGDTSVTLFLSEMTGAIGRMIKWFFKRATDTAYTLVGETSMTSSATSTSKVVTGLINETAYNFKSEIYDTADTDYVVGLKTATATTQKRVAVMSLATATSVSLRVNLSEMETNLNYDKHIYWYIKRATDATFMESGVDIVRNGDVSSISRLFTGLISSTINPDGTFNEANYNIRAVIKKNDVTTMATITGTYATTLRDSDIPLPSIIEALQVVGEKKAEIWWEAPEHITSSEAYVHYDIEMSTDGLTYSKVETVDMPPAEYTMVAFGAFDTDYYVRIKAYPSGTSEDKKYSNIIKVRMTENFDWETVVQSETCIVRADKWNLIVRYIKKRLGDKGITVPYDFIQARAGKSITAEMFNQLVTACNTFYETGVTEKQPGDAIRAFELIDLQTAVNHKEV